MWSTVKSLHDTGLWHLAHSCFSSDPHGTVLLLCAASNRDHTSDIEFLWMCTGERIRAEREVMSVIGIVQTDFFNSIVL